MSEAFQKLRTIYIPFRDKIKLKDKQIKHLTKYLTTHQISRHGEMLYKMDTKMFIMNKTIQDIMLSIDFLRYESDILDYFQARFLEYIHHFMPSKGMWTHYMSI